MQDLNSNFLMRGIIVEDIDPEKKGRLGVYIPRLMDKYSERQNSGANSIYDYGRHVRNLPFDESSDIKKMPRDLKISDYLWASCSHLIGDVSTFIVPKKGQVVFCFMEDGDPKKLFWMPLSPNLSRTKRDLSQLISTKLLSSNERDKEARNIAILINLPNGNTIGFDYNERVNSFEINLPSMEMSIRASKNEEKDEMVLETKGNLMKLDEKNKKMSLTSEYNISIESKKDVKVKVGGKGYLN